MDSLIHFGMLAGIKTLDSLISTKWISKYGLDVESNPITKKYIEKWEIKKGMFIKNIKDQATMLGSGLILYGLDYLLKIESYPINFHKAYLSFQTLIGTGIVLKNIIATTIIFPIFYSPVESENSFSVSDFLEEVYKLDQKGELEDI